jgi:hypothetical protein
MFGRFFSSAAPAATSVASNGNLAADVGQGVGSAVRESEVIPQGIGTIEKIMIGSVILGCIIFLIIGLSLLMNGNYSSGFILTLLGGGVMAASVWWLRNPPPAYVRTGRGEDETVVESYGKSGGEDFEDEVDIDYLEVEDATS